MNTRTVRIDPELRDLLPAPSAESREKLKQNILLNGIKDPPSAYCPDHGTDTVLLDGHTRYLIWCEIAEPPMDPNDPKNLSTFFAEQHGDIDRTVITMAEAKQWIIDRQIGRRNCTPKEMEYLRGLDYELAKQPHGGQTPNEKGSDHFDHLKTAEKIAKKHGVSAPTVRRNAEFKKDIDAVEAVVPGTKAAVLSGEKKVTAKALKEAAKAAKAAKTQEENAKVARAIQAAMDKTKHLSQAQVDAATKPEGFTGFRAKSYNVTITLTFSTNFPNNEDPEISKTKGINGIKHQLSRVGGDRPGAASVHIKSMAVEPYQSKAAEADAQAKQEVTA